MVNNSSSELAQGKWYVRIGTDLRQQIVSGKLQPGDRLPTEKELAGVFGVSVQTVRQAQQALIQEGLIRKEQGRGTFVSERARRHWRALLVCGIEHADNTSGREAVSPYYQDSIRFCHQAAQARGLSIETLWMSNHAPGWDEAKPDEGIADAVSGYIFLGCDTRHPLVRHVQQKGWHYVHLGKPSIADRTVWFDFAAASQLAWDSMRDTVRSQGMEVVVVSIIGEQMGAEALARLVPGGVRYLQIPNSMSIWEYERWSYHCIHRLCANRTTPAAFVFLDDILARGGTRALLQTGWGAGRCPVAVVCGQQEIESYGLPVTYVAHDTQKEAQWAVEMLSAQIEGDPKGAEIRQSPFELAECKEPAWEPVDIGMTERLDSLLV